MVWCTNCGQQLPDGARFCSRCATPVVLGGPPAPSISSQRAPQTGIWFQSYYRIRKKVIAIANQYWIEDQRGITLGYTKQKLIRLKEDIRIYTDESMAHELFKIRQEQVVDMWGTFAVIDTATNVVLGKLKRKALAQVGKDEYLLLDFNGQTVGRVAESSGRGLARKYLPGGKLVPEHVFVEFNGQQVAEIKQQFKVIGDIWEVDCSRVPLQFDRRTLLACMIIMGIIERDRK